MKSIRILPIAFLISILSSCSDYLDIVPDNVATIENAFTMRTTAEKYLFTCYSYIPRNGDQWQNPGFTAGDELWFPNVTLTVAPGFYIARGDQNVNSPRLNYWDGENRGQALFRGLRDCNIFLENVGKVPDLSVDERNRWIAEVKFLKAYYHFYLLRMYGPIPLIKENMPISAGVADVQIERRPVDEGFNYIVELLDQAAADLPERIENPTSEAGRINKVIALAVKAKVLVTAASPLFNGNNEYAGFNNKSGEPLFNTTYSAEKWERAVVACKQAIDLAALTGHELFYYSQSATQYNVTAATKTKLSIRNSVTEKWNREILWANTNSLTAGLQVESTPRGLDPRYTANSTVRGSFAPTLKMVETFYTENGVPISEDKTWDFGGRFNLKTATEEDKLNLKPNYEIAALHFDREPRFYASLGFDGGAWYGQGRYDDLAPWYLEAKKGQAASRIGEAHSVTGYWPKKLVNFLNVIEVNSYSVRQYPWPEMRLADLYLLYAEALNEASGPQQEVYTYLNMIRTRAGIPTVEEAWTQYSNQPGKYMSKEGLREIIRQERTIELAFEGQRFWDIRRWKTAVRELNAPVKGWDIEQAEAANYYREKVLFTQRFSMRDYFWPIKEIDLIVNKNLVQNPGW